MILKYDTVPREVEIQPFLKRSCFGQTLLINLILTSICFKQIIYFYSPQPCAWNGEDNCFLYSSTVSSQLEFFLVYLSCLFSLWKTTVPFKPLQATSQLPPGLYLGCAEKKGESKTSYKISWWEKLFKLQKPGFILNLQLKRGDSISNYYP